MNNYIVIGLGRFGSGVARQLCKLGCEVLAMDVSSDLVQHISTDVTHAVVGDGQDKEVLRALGVEDFDCAIVSIGGDLAASILVHDETHRKVLQKLGADRVVIPEQENAIRLAHSLSRPNVLDYIELSQEYSIIEVPAPAFWYGKDLRELNVRAKLGVNILAIRRAGKINVSPAAEFAFAAGDIVVVLGDSAALKKVQKL